MADDVENALLQLFKSWEESGTFSGDNLSSTFSILLRSSTITKPPTPPTTNQSTGEMGGVLQSIKKSLQASGPSVENKSGSLKELINVETSLRDTIASQEKVIARPTQSTNQTTATETKSGTPDLCSCICQCLKDSLRELQMGGGGTTNNTQIAMALVLKKLTESTEGPGTAKKKVKESEEKREGMRLGEGIKAAGGQFRQMLSHPQTKAEQSGAAAFRGVGELGKGLGGTLGKALGGIGAIGAVAFESVGRLREWSSQLHRSNMEFAEFSGSMRAVQQEQEARRIQFEAQRGEARAGSSRELAEALSRLQNQLAPVEDAMANLKNNIAAAMSNALSTMLDDLRTRFPGLQRFLGEPQVQAGGQALSDWAHEQGREVWQNTYGRPPGMFDPWTFPWNFGAPPGQGGP